MRGNNRGVCATMFEYPTRRPRVVRGGEADGVGPPGGDELRDILPTCNSPVSQTLLHICRNTRGVAVVGGLATLEECSTLA